jgi:cytoskeletal protein CcmA (bactofilin family)
VLTSTGSGGLTWTSGAAATTAITVTANAQPNITSVGTLTSLAVSGNITAGNVTVSGRFVGNGAGLTGIAGSGISGQVGNALTAGTVYSNAQPNITSVGTLSALSVSGNISAGNVTVSGRFFGNGSALSAIAGANVVGAVANATYATSAGSASSATTASTATSATTATNASFATSAGSATSATTATRAATVTTNAQPNITSVGTLSSLSVSGSAGISGALTAGSAAISGALTKGGASVLTAADFTTAGSGAATGWTRLPNGFLLQYGTAFVNRQNYTNVFYPISFSSFSVAVCSGSTQSNGDGSQGAPGVTSTTTSGFTTFFGTDGGGSGITIRWVAIGY